MNRDRIATAVAVTVLVLVLACIVGAVLKRDSSIQPTFLEKHHG